MSEWTLLIYLSGEEDGVKGLSTPRPRPKLENAFLNPSSYSDRWIHHFLPRGKVKKPVKSSSQKRTSSHPPTRCELHAARGRTRRQRNQVGLEKRHNVRLIDISLTLFVRDLVVESFGPETREIKLETRASFFLCRFYVVFSRNLFDISIQIVQIKM